MKKHIKIRLIMALLFLIIGTCSANEMKAQAAPSPVTICTKEEWEVLKLVNQERLARNLTPLSTFSKLQKAANIRAKEIGTQFGHDRPNGGAWYTVLTETGAPNYNSAGENIAAGQNAAKTVMKGWMNSSGHKVNILNTNYTHLGAGYYYSARSYYGKYWTQIFEGFCTPSSISVKNGNTIKTYRYGATIEEMNLVLVVKCRHGSAYMPILTKMCSGFQINSAGTQTVKVSHGGLSTQFKIKIAGTSIQDATISNIKNKTYSGQNLTQAPKVVLNGITLKKNKDYTLSYKNNKNIGTATVIIKGKGKYFNTVKKNFIIKKRSIKETSINRIKSQTYTGKRIKPAIKMKYNGTVISKNNYTVKYSNNIKAGTAKVTIKGKRNISGTITRTFRIVKKNT